MWHCVIMGYNMDKNISDGEISANGHFLLYPQYFLRFQDQVYVFQSDFIHYHTIPTFNTAEKESF